MKPVLIASAIVVTVLFTSTHNIQAGKTPGRPLMVSPHSKDALCTDCHKLSKEKLNRKTSAMEAKRKLKGDPNVFCKECHDDPSGHSLGKKPRVNKANLPLASDGTMTCLTCHDVHQARSLDSDQRNSMLRLPQDQSQLCFSCHEN